jgi:hypothetical protein
MKIFLLVSSLLAAAAVAKDMTFAESEEQRQEYIVQAKVQKRKWTPEKTATFDLSKAPDVKYDRLKRGGTLECTFKEIDENKLDDPAGGRTPKFKCDFEFVDDKGRHKTKTLKVKYDPYHLYRENSALYSEKTKAKDWKPNAEVYGEVLATRLLSSVGFYADRIYTFDKIICKNCPIEPWTYIRQFYGILDDKDNFIGFTKGELLKSNNTADHLAMDRSNLVISPAVIEYKIGGEKIELASNGERDAIEGCDIGELFSNLPKGERADEERLRREALTIFIAFINHMDNKAEQQRIICKDDDIIDYGNGTAFCKDPIIMVQDAGSNFGNGFSILQGDIRLNKLDLKKWMKLQLWKNADTCTIQVNEGISSTFDQMEVSEAGQLYLASFLSQLTLSQVKEYFVASKIGLWPVKQSWSWWPFKNEMERLSEIALGSDVVAAAAAQDEIAQKWADGFMRKLNDQLINFQCGNIQATKTEI